MDHTSEARTPSLRWQVGGVGGPIRSPNQAISPGLAWHRICSSPGSRRLFPTTANPSWDGDAKPRIRLGLTAGLPKEGRS